MPKIFHLENCKNIAEYSDAMGLTMSLGMFDGVHKGHQEIIKTKSIVKPTSWKVHCSLLAASPKGFTTRS